MKESSKVLNDDPVLERIMSMLREQNKSDKELIDSLGMSNGVFTGWKYKGGRSYIKHIREIADFLGTSTGYLLHGVDDDLYIEGLSEKETNILQLFRRLDEAGQACATEVMERFVAAGRK